MIELRKRLLATAGEVEHLQAELEAAQANGHAEWERAERFREAIIDALADLTPGIAPYSVLKDALDA